MNAGRIDGMNGLHSRQHGRNDIARKLMNELAECRVFLWWTAHDRKRPNRAGAVIDPLHLQHRKIMREAVIAQMVAEWTLRLEWSVRIDVPHNAKVRVGIDRQ